MLKKVFPLSLLACFISISSALGGTPTKAENFTLPDYNGVKHSLSDYKDAKAIVVMFIATQCPVSNSYNERMVSLYNDYTPKHVSFIGINSNKQESAEEVKHHAEEHGFKFTVLKDDKNVIADKFGATVTPEIYVIEPSTLKILYHGRIDNAMREAKVTSHDLRTALDEILSDKPVAVTETKAFGCTIKKID
ncbi:MAG: thioredoxin family protein [Bacteroidota bacterium]|nr:thioredoxin family protein [Bacteroidota bacterium]